jgi:hypothetical protein
MFGDVRKALVFFNHLVFNLILFLENHFRLYKKLSKEGLFFNISSFNGKKIPQMKFSKKVLQESTLICLVCE